MNGDELENEHAKFARFKLTGKGGDLSEALLE